MSERLNIMQICGSPSMGGAEAFFLRLCRALHRHDKAELLPVVRRDSWLSQRLADMDIPHETCTFGGRFDLFTRPRLKRLMRRFQPDIAQTWMNRASSFLPRGIAPSVGRLGGYYDLKYYEGIDRLIGNTEDICRYIREEGWPEDRVHYIPNFVDIPPAGFKSHGDAIRTEHHIPDSAVVILVAARLHPVKGIDTALSALAKLPNHVHLLLAGAGEEEAALRAQAETSGISKRVHFLGWVNDITPLCAAADIFLVPSRSEPLGNVVLEAWAHAMPLVSTEAEGPLQLITPRENGLLVPIDDAVEMANAIIEILANPNLAVLLAEGGLATLQERFSEQAVVEQYLDFYRMMQKEDTPCAA
jgi:glycosyltransferase involved in cell wall biosynthesis